MQVSKLKIERIRRGILQMDLAREVGISESLLSKIETGRIVPGNDLLTKIAGILGVATGQISDHDSTTEVANV